MITRKALVVAAHPDDVDYLASGTVARWAAEGVETTYCVVTDGDAGWSAGGVSRAHVAAVRRAEQTAAAKVVGVEDVRFLGYPDGELELSGPLRRDLARVVRQVRPQRMVMPSPEINWERMPDSHPDHRVTGEAALRVAYPEARNPLAHRELLDNEGLEAFAVPQLWIFGGPRPNHHVDVTDVFELKLAALREHASQTAHLADLEEQLRRWLGDNARRAGLRPGRLAESFQVASTA
ncbi:PIG-L family deacetylase [Solihabitans fulvus]|uniref:PIG-L family deacetylase n=1 Tax=Solihabitans fulvus TaxID=1892852 RepID=A0A5B2XDB1_9PSEU|nr:PIG-L deacetylase family protein [Solihabitans fulvus]KAA2261085.1 PIG-L family deacetylase [Solihabitans fulvus]